MAESEPGRALQAFFGTISGGKALSRMTPREKIIYLSSTEWNAITQRPQHVARLLSRKYDVTYVQPVGVRSIQWRDLPRITLRLRRPAFPGGVPLGPSLSVVNLFYVPFLRSRWVTRRNMDLLLNGIRRKVPGVESGDFILWITSPSLLARVMMGHTAPKRIVYDCMDEYAAMHQEPFRSQIAETEEYIVKRADIAFASAAPLAERLRRINPNCAVVSNGVDVSRFHPTAAQDLSVPEDMACFRHPIIGYYGTLAEWVDYDLLNYVARARPDWQIVLIGPRKTSLKKVLEQPNVAWLGPKQYWQLPQYARFFDLATIPFLVNQVTRAVSPVKMFEYLALGKPVVSTELPEVARFGEVVSVARSKEDFAEAIERELRSPSVEEKVQRRFEVAQAHSWEAKVQEMEDLLERTKPATVAEP